MHLSKYAPFLKKSKSTTTKIILKSLENRQLSILIKSVFGIVIFDGKKRYQWKVGINLSKSN